MFNEVMKREEGLHKTEISRSDFASSEYDDCLAYILSQEETSNIDLDKFIKHMKDCGIGPVGICAICGKHYVYGGYSPHPVIKDEDARCCDRCHDEIVDEARDEADYSIIYESKGRKPKDTFSLHKNSNIIMNHLKRVDVMRVIAASSNRTSENRIYDFVDMEYKAPFFIFKQAGADEVVTIDQRKIVMSSITPGHDLLIYVDNEYGPWSFCPYFEDKGEHDSTPNVNRSLHPHELKELLAETAVIESCINALLSDGADRVARAYVRFRPSNKGDKKGNQNNPHSHWLDVSVGNDDEQFFVASFGDTLTYPRLHEEVISKDIITVIARELMKRLFTIGRRNKSNH